jgi:hypothetical protein
LSPDTVEKSPVSSRETPKPSGSSFLQSTSYLSVAGPSRTTQEKIETVKKNALSNIIPTPEKKQSSKKHRKQETRHLTSDSNFEETLVKRRLKMEKEDNAKCVPETKLHRAPRRKASDKYVLPIPSEDSDENTPCGFCILKYCSVFKLSEQNSPTPEWNIPALFLHFCLSHYLISYFITAIQLEI